MKVERSFDLEMLKEKMEYCKDLKTNYDGRNEILDDCVDMFLLNSDEIDKLKDEEEKIKLTIDPGPRNAAQGVINLLKSSDPVWTVPFRKNLPNIKKISTKLKKVANIWWSNAGRLRGDPVHWDILRSATIFGEVHASITSTKDILESFKEQKSAQYKRAEKIAKTTPFIYDVHDPRQGYADHDMFGMSAYYYETKARGSEIYALYGDDGMYAMTYGDNKYKPNQEFTIQTLWELDYHHVWLDGVEVPVVQDKNEKPFIPIVSQYTEGTKLFETAAERTTPFLYTMLKTGLWNRKSLSLTAWYTQIAGVGLNPMFIERLGADGARVNADMSRTGGRWVVPHGSGGFEVVSNKGIIDPAAREAYDLARELEVESTIYRQTLGQPMGNTTAYSYVAMLNMAGRVSIVGIERKSAWTIADLMSMSFEWMKHDKRDYELDAHNENIFLEHKDIPDDFVIEAQLKVDIKQDRLQQAALADKLTHGDVDKGIMPKVSNRYVREELLGVDNSEDMDEEIATEMAGTMMVLNFIRNMMQNAQMQEQAQGEVVPGGDMMGGGMGAGQEEEVLLPEGVPEVMERGGAIPEEGIEGY